MEIKLLYEKDADLSVLKDKTIAVIGYGSQGHAQAQNLKDSGFNVIIGLRKGSKSAEIAQKDGFEVYSIEEAAEKADIIQILIPDEVQKDIYEKYIKKGLKEGDALVFSHGFNIHFGRIVPPEYVDVYMVAPKGPGHLVRRVYKEGFGVPALIAVYQDYTGKARDLALAHACGIGAGRAGIIESTFKEETETDLFGEQAVLCGGLVELIKSGFETLVEAGYKPEVAYFETFHEVKLIVDLLYEKGIEGMFYSISDTAEYGALTVGPKIITKDVKEKMKKALEDIQTGKFAKEWILENEAGRPEFNARYRMTEEHLIEKVGKELRSKMSWINNKK